MTNELEYYHVPLSQPSRTGLLLLKLVNAPHQVKIVDLDNGEHMKPGFLALNPFHQVPVVKDGDFVLTESVAIAKYIVNKVKCDDHWYPVDIQKRARVDEYLAYHHTGTRRGCRGVAMNFVFRKQPVPQEEKDAAWTEFLSVLDQIECYFLKRGPFIIGDKISIADLFAISEITQAKLGGIDFLSSRPKLNEWMERVKKETSPHFDDVFKTIDEFIATRFK